MFGITHEQAIGKSLFDFAPAETHDQIRERIASEAVESVEMTAIRPDGRKIIFEVFVRQVIFHGILRRMVVTRDITGRKLAEQALRESEEKFKLAFKTNPDSININRLSDGMYVDINDGFSRITGYTSDDVIGKTSLEIKIWDYPDDREGLTEGSKAKGRVENLEARFRMKDGKVIYGLMSAAVILLNNEPHILTITRDITERIEIQEALHESEERYRQLLELAPVGIAVHQDNKVVFCNPQASIILGASTKEELIGKTTEEIILSSTNTSGYTSLLSH